MKQEEGSRKYVCYFVVVVVVLKVGDRKAVMKRLSG